MNRVPIPHPHAKSFRVRHETGADGADIEILEVETDLAFADLCLTNDERSLVDAVGDYMGSQPGRRAEVFVRLEKQTAPVCATSVQSNQIAFAG